MRCTNPVKMPLFGIERPCGRCLACRIEKCKEWEMRVAHEAVYFDRSCFATLTFSDEHLPANGSVSKRDMQLFLKRLREDLKEREIRYFACGEYGDVTGRPHYHALLLGIGFDEHEFDLYVDKLAVGGPVVEAWGKGGVYVGPIGQGAIRYVVDYIFKAYEASKEKGGNVGKRERPFKAHSKGLGKRWIKDNEQMIEDNLTVRYKGRLVSLPRYYYDKWKGDKVNLSRLRADDEYRARIEHLRELSEKGIRGPDLEEYKASSRYQRDLELKAMKERMKSRRPFSL